MEKWGYAPETSYVGPRPTVDQTAVGDVDHVEDPPDPAEVDDDVDHAALDHDLSKDEGVDELDTAARNHQMKLSILQGPRRTDEPQAFLEDWDPVGNIQEAVEEGRFAEHRAVEESDDGAASDSESEVCCNKVKVC